MKDFNSGVALWNQRLKLKKTKSRLKQLADAVGHISDSSLAQYAQMFAITLEFKPDLIVEFGRGAGNSTAVFTEVANQLTNCKVISICLSSDWQEKTSLEIAKVVPKKWFDRLDAIIANIFDIDIRKLVKKSKKILFLWDAHGWNVAEYVLAKVMPAIRNKEHIVLIHDISYFDQKTQADYGSHGVWKGYPGDEIKDLPYVVVDSMTSPFEEVIAIHDFAARNKLKILSVQEQINDIFRKNKNARDELNSLLGRYLADSSSSFHYFSQNTIPKGQKIFYPKFQKLSQKLEYPAINFSRRKNSYSNFQENRPLVSIVTPSLNSGKFLEECIQSVINQDYPLVEHIIQDGGSGDNTLKILKKYSAPRYKGKINWISEADKGQSDGLDKGLKRANGEVILVLNADDILLPYACSWGVLHLVMNPDIAVVYGDEYIIDGEGKIIHEFTGPRYDYEKVLCVEIVPAAQAAFVRKSYFEQVGLGADSTLSTCPDYEMWVRIGARFPMKYVPGFVSKYRWHKESEGQKPQMILKMIEAKKEVMDRVFNDKKTPKRIKKLRKRAYAGVEMWGAINNMQLRGPVPITAKLVISGFLNYPRNIVKYRKLIPGGIISFSRFVLKKYEKKVFH